LSYSRTLRGASSGVLRLLSTQSQQHTTTQADNDQAKELLPSYSQEQRLKILQAVNESNLDQMIGYDITKARASKLLTWKARNGPLQEVSDILYVEGFGLKVAKKFFKSLLEPAGEGLKSGDIARRKAARTAPFITPALDEGQRLRIASSVGVRIGVTSVSWARLEIGNSGVPSLLTHWQHHELNDKKLHLAELVRRCLYVAHQIPQADCYVLESPQMAQASSNPGSIDQQNINIQKAQVSAIISYALMSRAEPVESKVNNLFFMRRFLTARLFNHLVGTERVSSEDAILTMMQTKYDMDQRSSVPPSPREMRHQVHFPANLQNLFNQQERYQRELLGQAFLLNLAFARLVLLQDPNSIATVSRHTKNPLPSESA
ncbi:hypothetical protein KR009_011905, partial [Drosophila setifemur]